MVRKPTYEELEQKIRELEAEVIESRLIQEAIKESETKYRAIAEDAPVFLCRFLPGGVISYVNDAYCNYFGKTREELIGEEFISLIPETERETVIANISSLTSDSPTQTHEHRVIAPNGDIRWHKWTNRALFDSQDKIIDYQSIGEDISDRKQAEESEREYRNLFNSLPDPVIIIKEDYNGEVNTAYTQLFGYSQKEIDKGLPAFKNIIGEDEAIIRDRIETRLAGRKLIPDLYSFEIISKEGRHIPCESKGTLIQYKGKPAILLVIRDTTERKNAEKELINNENRLKMALEAANEGLWELYPQTGEVYIDHRLSTLLDYKADEVHISYESWLKKAHPEDMSLADKKFKEFMNNKEKSFSNEIRIRNKKGDWRWILLRGKATERDDDGNVTKITGTHLDITERKKSEEALAQNEERLRLAVEATQDGLWDWNLIEDKILFSPRLKEMLGYEKDEQIPVSMDEWVSRVHPNQRGRFSQLEEFIKETKSFNMDYLMLIKNREYRWFNSRCIVLLNEKGDPYRIVGSTRDINKEKQTEELIRKLTQSLFTSQENERQMISRELHDSVAQDLSSSKIVCDMLLKYKTLPPGARTKISEISTNLHKTLKSVRDLSYELRPPGLEKLGFANTIHKLLNDFSKQTGVPVDFKSAGIDNLNLDYHTKINLYRLIQEGLNNVRKHAYASNVRIRIVSSFPNIILRIIDDGKGFDLMERKAAISNEKRMGLRSMEERVDLLQGRIKIESNPGKGTKVSIEIPYKGGSIGA